LLVEAQLRLCTHLLRNLCDLVPPTAVPCLRRECLVDLLYGAVYRDFILELGHVRVSFLVFLVV
jgi:hypothetical protein